MSIEIAATFINRHYDPDVIELVHAWDLACVEENPSGYEDTKREELAQIGSELLRAVTVEIAVDDERIRDALNPTGLGETGKVLSIAPLDLPADRAPERGQA